MGYKKSTLFLNTGVSLLNLALTDEINGGFPAGKIISIAGDKAAGKSFIANTVLACACNDPKFENYKRILDDSETANEFNMAHLFGEKASEEIVAPKYDEEGYPIVSETLEQLDDFLNDLLDQNQPFVYVIDSLDALSCNTENEDYEANREKRRKQQNTSGSYKTARPKYLSEMLRRLRQRIHKTNSIFIIISQARDNLNPMSHKRNTKSGGRALDFYSDVIMWMKIQNKIKKSVRNKNRSIGVKSEIEVERTKTNGKSRTFSVPIYYEYGIDDLKACFEWLKDEKFITGKNSVAIEELEMEGRVDTLIKKIENENLEEKFYNYVQKCWIELENALKIAEDRKPRFG